MDNGIGELKAWIKRNAEHFKEGQYTSNDIANLAIAAGFDRQAVAAWETEIDLHINSFLYKKAS